MLINGSHQRKEECYTHSHYFHRTEADVENDDIKAEWDGDAEVTHDSNCCRVGALVGPRAQILTQVISDAYDEYQ